MYHIPKKYKHVAKSNRTNMAVRDGGGGAFQEDILISPAGGAGSLKAIGQAGNPAEAVIRLALTGVAL